MFAHALTYIHIHAALTVTGADMHHMINSFTSMPLVLPQPISAPSKAEVR